MSIYMNILYRYENLKLQGLYINLRIYYICLSNVHKSCKFSNENFSKFREINIIALILKKNLL